MIDIFRERCFGCTACSSICPQKAISFEEDQLGFVYPVIDKTKCISCNLCEKRCPVQIYSSISHTLPKQVYAARHISLKEVKTSRSGAAFIALSDVVLKQGGTVFGASFVEGLKVKHIKTSNPHERDLLKGSKYVQSDMRGVIDEIIEELRAGNKVLFSGTPCQVAGLVSAVPKSLQTILYTLDIVCHGAPSPQLYKDYLTLLENKYGSKVLYFNFRDKSINGWHDHKESALLENGQKIVDKTYTNLFYTNCFFRDSCYACPFANTNRISDITIGDLWGWESIDKTLNDDDLGVSLIIVNTEKGDNLVEEAKPSISLMKTDLEKCMQRNLKEPTPIPSVMSEYVSVYVKKGIAGLIKYLYHPSIYQRIIRRIKRLSYNG